MSMIQYLFDCVECGTDVTDRTEVRIPRPDLPDIVHCPACFRAYELNSRTPLFGAGAMRFYFDTNGFTQLPDGSFFNGKLVPILPGGKFRQALVH